MAKPNGKKKAPNFNGLKQARANCREQALNRNVNIWPLCWNKYVGYYCPQHQFGNADCICHVDKSGALTYVSKAVQRIHKFKHYVNPIGYYEGK